MLWYACPACHLRGRRRLCEAFQTVGQHVLLEQTAQAVYNQSTQTEIQTGFAAKPLYCKCIKSCVDKHCAQSFMHKQLEVAQEPFAEQVAVCPQPTDKSKTL